MSTQTDVTPDYKWRKSLADKLEELACAETLLKRTEDPVEFRVLCFACVCIEQQIAKYIQHLGGLGAAW